jgi:signal peptidase I
MKDTRKHNMKPTGVHTSKDRPARKSTAREYAEAVIMAVVLTFFVRAFVIQAFRIPTGSMMDTLLIGDFLFVNKFIYGPKIPYTAVRLPGLRSPRPGDIMVFKYPGDLKRDFIKRCIAVGGQTVEIRNKVVYVDGMAGDEPYVIRSDPRILPKEVSPRDNMDPLYVPQGYLFMMGDNRDNSLDSRFWGPLDVRLVKGKAMIIYWSHKEKWYVPRLDRVFHVIR